MKNQVNSREIGKTILLFLALGGLAVTLAAFPGLGLVLQTINKKEFGKYPRHRISQSLKRLQKQELISIKEEDDQISISLSEKGKLKVLKYKIEEMKLKRDHWDRVWRMVIFDIPEEKREARDFLRTKMKDLGFFSLQKSVLVTPWKCRDEIDFIKNFYDVADCVKLVEASKFDGEDKAKVYFNL